MLKQFVEVALVTSPDWNQHIIVEQHFIGQDFLDVLFLHGITAMDADERIEIAFLEQRPEARQYAMPFLRRHDLGVILQRFEVQNIVQLHLRLFVSFLDVNRIAADARLKKLRLVLEFEIILDARNGLRKTVEFQWLDDEIECVEFEAFHRVFRMRGDENTRRNMRGPFAEFDAAQFGHVDVQKQDLDVFFVEYRKRVFGVRENPENVQNRKFFGKRNDRKPVNFIVVDNDAVVCGHDWVEAFSNV
jgi:hypothetical protein